MTLAYFAPDRRYSPRPDARRPTREFQQMVAAFHDAGLKVFVDVVYNHTGEGGGGAGTPPRDVVPAGSTTAPTTRLTNDAVDQDNTGVSGNFNTFNPVAQDLIIDSLAYWHETLGVDGFRFDLASVLGNTCEHGCFRFEHHEPAARRSTASPASSGALQAAAPGVDLIAEPWAIGGGTYQVGNFPRLGRVERRLSRRAAQASEPARLRLGDPGGSLRQPLAGSRDLFGDDGRRPWHSVNFLVAHDGFTLRDLYACNGKNNRQAWPYGPSDGGDDDNRSWDQGGIAAEQRKAARTGMALMMLSAGMPMITGGDEFLRTQFGNNNAYNLDSAANWIELVAGYLRGQLQQTLPSA